MLYDTVTQVEGAGTPQQFVDRFRDEMEGSLSCQATAGERPFRALDNCHHSPAFHFPNSAQSCSRRLLRAGYGYGRRCDSRLRACYPGLRQGSP